MDPRRAASSRARARARDRRSAIARVGRRLLLRACTRLALGFGAHSQFALRLRSHLQFALRLLMIASEFDAATGGVNPDTQTFATIRVLRPSGVETIDAEQQGQFLHS